MLRKLLFSGEPEYVDILAEGDIEAVTLANNHSKDHFEQGMTDTKAILDEKESGILAMMKVV